MGCTTTLPAKSDLERTTSLSEIENKPKEPNSRHAKFIDSIHNISEIQLSPEIKFDIIQLFQKYTITKRMFHRASKHDMKELLTTNIPIINENQLNTVYYALYHCDDKHKPLETTKCGTLTVSKGTTLHLKSDTIFEYDSICLEEDSILTTTPWNSGTKCGGRLYINSKSNIILHKNAKIDVSELGYDECDDGNEPKETESDLFELKMGRGRGGGTIKMHCKKLMMYRNAKIVSNGKRNNKRCGGAIFIDCDNIVMTDTAKIYAASNGRIGLSISSFRFADQFLSSTVVCNNRIVIPDVILSIIIKYWGFSSIENRHQIQPQPYLFVK